MKGLIIAVSAIGLAVLGVLAGRYLLLEAPWEPLDAAADKIATPRGFDLVSRSHDGTHWCPISCEGDPAQVAIIFRTTLAKEKACDALRMAMEPALGRAQARSGDEVVCPFEIDLDPDGGGAFAWAQVWSRSEYLKSTPGPRPGWLQVTEPPGQGETLAVALVHSGKS